MQQKFIPTIMDVVAVFEIHIERNAVGSMKPSIRRRGLVPGVKSNITVIIKDTNKAIFKMFDKYCSNMILIYIPLIAN